MVDIWRGDFYISLWKMQRTVVKLSSSTEHSAQDELLDFQKSPLTLICLELGHFAA